MIDVIADWCDALRGGIPLQEAFAGLALGLNAEAGMLVRTSLTDFRPARVVVWDRQGAGNSPLTRSHADSCFGEALARPRSGSLWLQSQHDRDRSALCDPGLEMWQERRGLSEFATLVLAGGSARRDHIELHFRRPVTETELATFESILPTMVRTWSARQAGLVTRCIVNHHKVEDKRPGPLPLLSTSNPARLSRAEFRVCLLLSRGLSVLSVAGELNVSEATVRSHLRSIYAKTGTTGLPDLVFRLLKMIDDGASTDMRCA